MSEVNGEMSVCYLLDSLGLGVRVRRSPPGRRNVFCYSHELLFEDVHRFLVPGHSLGAVPHTLSQGEPS